MAWQLHSLVDQIHDWAVTTFRPFILNRLEAWHSYSIAAQIQFSTWNSTEITSQNLDSDSESKSSNLKFLNNLNFENRDLSWSPFRARVEDSMKKGTQEALDILDQEESQQQLDSGVDDFMEISKGEPWWAKNGKPEVTRQRLLSSKALHPHVPNAPRKRRLSVSETQRERKQYKRLNSAYNAQELKQKAEKVQVTQD
jgi:hypothetical protein